MNLKLFSIEYETLSKVWYAELGILKTCVAL